MSGIFGAWQLTDRHIDASASVRCARELVPAGTAATSSPIEPLSLASTPNAPLTYRHLSCVFDGRLDNRAELEAQLEVHPARNLTPDAAIVMAAYDQFEGGCVDHLDGDFVFAIFDDRKKVLLLARDRLGLRPLCYTQVGDTFVFATNAKALLVFPGVKAVPDDAMLADAVLYFLAADGQARTFFSGIRSLPPAHCLDVTPRGLTVRRYFDFDTSARLQLATVDDYVDAFRDIFTTSVRKRLRSSRPVAISVSGGLDSSYIYCVARQIIGNEPGLCPSVTGVNYGGRPGSASDETAFLLELERATGTSIERVAQRPGFLESASREVWHTETAGIEGLARLREAFLSHVHDHQGAARLLTGHWGDQVLSDSSYVQDLFRRGKLRSCDVHRRKWGIRRSALARRVARDMIARYAPSSLESFLIMANGATKDAWALPWFTKRFRRTLRERFSAPRVPRVAGTSHAWSIYQQVRLGYHLHCMEWNARIGDMFNVEMAFPYLDRQLIQFLMSIPGEILSHDGAQRGLMRKAMCGVVPPAIVNRTTKGEFTQLANEGVERDFPAIRDLLGSDAVSVQLGYVDGPVLWSHLDRWRNEIRTADDGVLSDRVIDLCGFELLLRHFFRDAVA